jgi:ABC-2 type transport system permease protein
VKVLHIVRTELLRTFRWKANIFFLLIMPMGLILLLGVAFGSSNPRIGVVEQAKGPLADRLVEALDSRPGLDIQSYGSLRSLEKAVERGYVSAGLLIPDGYDRRLKSGQTVTARFFARPDSQAPQIRVAVESAAADQSATITAAKMVETGSEMSLPVALRRVASIDAVPPVKVRTLDAAGGSYSSSSGQFQQSASTQLLLFTFLSALMGAIWLIETRRLGMARRMLSTPSSTRTIMFGIVLGRWAIVLIQSALIIFFSWLIFSVDWGNPLATGAIVLSFSLVAVGAGLLIGTSVSREQQAGPISMVVGLVFAAIGGSMEPLQYFPSTMRKIAHITPHAWANEAFNQLLIHGGGLGSVWHDVLVLCAFATALLVLATWRLRRVLTS